MLKKCLLVLLSLVALSACNFVDSFKETSDQADVLASRLEKEIGSKPLVSWNIHNNKLANVNVIFESQHVGTRTFGDLEPQVRKAVEEEFKRKPSMLVISVKSSQP